MDKLSAYTHARNCTDLNDLGVGLEELRRAVRMYESRGGVAPGFVYIRIAKIKIKMNYWTTKKTS